MQNTAANIKTIKCRICGDDIIHVGLHLKEKHPDATVDSYRAEFPDAPLMSDEVAERIRQRQREQSAQQVNMEHSMSGNVVHLHTPDRKAHLHDVFELGNASAARNALGQPIEIAVLGDSPDREMVPDVDPAYIFNIDLLKQVLVAFERNIPLYVWGYHGCGKTSSVQQVCAKTNRPTYRVQHTLNMIESDVVGGWRAKDGSTYYDLGPLPLAMLRGWVYLCDEYDRAPPGVVSLYQAVLERQPLVIKDAPPEYRVIKPHRNFRFAATGNTNGSGDESGLYAGTLIGDAANYSRFGITERAPYLPFDSEVALLRAKHSIPEAWAKELVSWASMIREGFDAGKISTTVGPRELLYAAEIGVIYANMIVGIKSAIVNRMNEIDRVTSMELAQRVWG